MAAQKQQQVAAVTQPPRRGPKRACIYIAGARPKFGFPIMWPRSSCMQDGIEGKRNEGACGCVGVAGPEWAGTKK